MEVLRRSSVFAAEIMDAFDRSPTDKELVAQAKALGREFVHARLLRAGLAWSAPERAAPAPGGRLAEVCTVLLRLGECGPRGRDPRLTLQSRPAGRPRCASGYNCPCTGPPAGDRRHPPLLGLVLPSGAEKGLVRSALSNPAHKAGAPRPMIPPAPHSSSPPSGSPVHPPKTSPHLPAQPGFQTLWK